MIKHFSNFLLLILVGLFTAFPLFAETFTWTDENGTMNFTEDYSKIPPKFRNKVNKREEVESDAPPAQNAASRGKDGDSSDVRPVMQGNALTRQSTDEPEGSYGGKKGEKWASEFRAINSEISLLEQKILEAKELNKKPTGLNKEQINRLPQEIVALVKQRNDAIKRYNDLNDRANNADVPAEFRK